MKRAAAVALVLLGCPVSDVGDTAAVGSETASGSETAGASETAGGSETDTSGAESESDTAEPCTGETCSSTLTLRFAHALPLLEGPHRFRIETPAYELLCSVEPSPEGDKSCFGFAFADLSWTPDLVTVLLTSPFFDAQNNPDATPFASVTVRVERGEELVYEAQVPVEAGEVIQPDPCGPKCWHAVADATIE